MRRVKTSQIRVDRDMVGIDTLRETIMKKNSKRAAKKISTSERFHNLIVKDEVVRKKLYAKFGRVRCYLYKTGRTTPNPDTAKIIEKITGISASAWQNA